MTLLEDRIETEPQPVPAVSVPRRSSPMSSWRFAARLAQREVRRRPGRTMLVMLLIAIPVFAMTVGSTAVRTSNAVDGYEREFGIADIGVLGNDGLASSPDLAAALPAGSRLADIFEVYSAVRTIDAAGLMVSPYVQLIDADLTDPLVAPLYRVTEGNAPASGSEVLLSGNLADRLGLGVGDTLSLLRPEMDVTVSGLGASARTYGLDVIVTNGLDRSLVRPGYGNSRILVDVPDSVPTADIGRSVGGVRELGVTAQSPTNFDWYDDDQQGQTLAWGWVAGVVAFIAVGIIIAAAFATSARRQLATIGQLSANGAPERLVRRTLGMQGMWTGLLGALLGAGAAVIGLQFSGRLFELVNDRVIDSVVFGPLDIAVIIATAVAAATIAALVPARSAARIPVLAALAGRRPLAKPPKWLVPVGVMLFASGLFFLGGAASSNNGGNFEAAIAILGSLMVLFGVVCASPLIVAWVGNVGSHLGGVGRLAARSLSRSRVRSAGVMTAIAVVSTLSIASLTAANSVRSTDIAQSDDFSIVDINYWQDVYPEATFDDAGNYVEPPRTFDPPAVVPGEFPAELRANIEQILPDAVWIPVAGVIENGLSEVDLSRLSSDTNFIQPTVASPQLLDKLDLSDAQLDRLNTTGTLALSPWVVGTVAVSTGDGPVELEVGEPVVQPEVDRDGNFVYTEGSFNFSMLITPELAAKNGFDVAVGRYIVDNPLPLTADQRNALNEVRPSQGDDAFVATASSDQVENTVSVRDGIWDFWFNSPSNQIPWPIIQALVLGASMLLVLGVVAIGLSLAAAESRDERDVLYVVGAAPKTLRRVAAAKAWVLTTGAAVVSIPVGYVVVKVVTMVNNEPAPFPFVGALAMLLVIPALVAGVSLVVSAVSQRFRPIAVSTMVVD